MKSIQKWFVVAAVALSFPAFAAEIQCGNVGGNGDEWRVWVSNNRKEASFFDNDKVVLLKRKYVKYLETEPRQKVYIYEGKDTVGGGRMRISFNSSQMTAFVTLKLKTMAEETLIAMDGCSEL